VNHITTAITRERRIFLARSGFVLEGEQARFNLSLRLSFECAWLGAPGGGLIGIPVARLRLPLIQSSFS
jgi:hypothetical protein